MKIFKLLLTSILLILLDGCESINSTKKERYNFSIVYDYIHPTDREDKFRSKFSKDKLYIFIESEFKNDTVRIIVDDKKTIEEIVSTEASSGLAKVIEIDDINKIEKLNFSINKSPEVSFEIIDQGMNFIGVSKRENNVELVFYKKTPVFE